MSVEQRLQRLEDIEAIKQLIARYMTAADHNAEPEMMAPCFTEDAVWHCEGIGGYEGRDAIVSGLREVSTERLSWALHYATQPIIEVADDGQTATGEYYLWELAKAVQEDGGPDKDTWVGGWYESKFRKEGERVEVQPHRADSEAAQPCRAPTWETPIPPWKG